MRQHLSLTVKTVKGYQISVDNKVLRVVDINMIGKEVMNAFFSIVMPTTSPELMRCCSASACSFISFEI